MSTCTNAYIKPELCSFFRAVSYFWWGMSRAIETTFELTDYMIRTVFIVGLYFGG